MVTPGSSPAALFALGVLPAILLIAFLNDRLYGSPLSSGYGTLNDLYAWSHVGPNVRRYFAWLVFAQTPFALAGLAALLVPSQSAVDGRSRPPDRADPGDVRGPALGAVPRLRDL